MPRAIKTTRIQYNDSLLRAFPLAIALACLTAVSIAMEWKSVRKGRGNCKYQTYRTRFVGCKARGVRGRQPRAIRYNVYKHA